MRQILMPDLWSRLVVVSTSLGAGPCWPGHCLLVQVALPWMGP